jgi:ADP-heptose:LPS heptosyltransferase
MEAAHARIAGRLINALRPIADATTLRLLPALLAGDRIAIPPDWNARPHRVLFVRYERIGDMIMATSLIRAIARSHPAIELDVLASRLNAAVLDGNPHVRRVLILGRSSPAGYGRLLRQVREIGYDAVVDGRINSPRVFLTTPLVMAAARARYRIGWCDADEPAARRLYNVCIPGAYIESGDVHYIDASARLATPFGVDVDSADWRPELFIRPTELALAQQLWGGTAAPRARLLVNLSAPGRGRRWPDDRFVHVIAGAKAEHPDLAVGVIGLPAEQASVRRIATVTGSVAISTPDIRTAFAVVEASDLVFTPDTSISHAASALRKPAVVMLRRDAASYAAYGNPGRTLLWDGDDITTIEPQAVIAAVVALLRDVGA